MVLAPVLVGCSTLACRRWGSRAGGLISAFPAVVGPLLLITAQLHGAAFAARAANGALLGIAALSAFMIAYGRTAPHASWHMSLGAGWLAAALAAAFVDRFAAYVAFPAGVVVAAISLATAHVAMPDDVLVPAASSTPSRGELPMRMAVTATLILLLAAGSQAFGALVGGMLAALPVLASVLAAWTHRADGAAMSVALLRGMMSGMIGFVAFCAVVALLIVPAGTALAFALGTATAAGLSGLALGLGERSSVGDAVGG